MVAISRVFVEFLTRVTNNAVTRLAVTYHFLTRVINHDCCDLTSTYISFLASKAKPPG